MEEEWICPICLEGDPQGCHHLVPCNHRFHTNCIMEHIRRSGPTCPYCRAEVDENHLPQQPIVHPDYEPDVEQEVILNNNINIINDADMFLQLFNFLNQLDNNNLNQIVNNLNENMNNDQVDNVLNNINHINNNYNFIVNNLFIQN